MSPLLMSPEEQVAQQALDELCEVVHAGGEAVAASPPGAGKTRATEEVADLGCNTLGLRVGVMTQTNGQAVDFVARMITDFPDAVVHFTAGGGFDPPAWMRGHPHVRIVQNVASVPPGRVLTVANSSKWQYAPENTPPYDFAIIDEAWQMTHALFRLLRGLAHRFIMIGDPGQITPIVDADVRRWRCDSAGPHVPAPEAFLQEAGVRTIRFPITRRLVQDTVDLIAPAFYPTLPFRALSAPGARGISTAARGMTAEDRLIDRLIGGESVVMGELSRRITGERDEEIADTIVRTVHRLLHRHASIRDERGARELEPGNIGVVAAHTTQVAAVAERLGALQDDVLVETANRWQGLQRDIILVHHPLSGRAELSEFLVESGRMCVMLSRHRIGCMLFGRAGIDHSLSVYGPESGRALGIDRDGEFDGWMANRRFDDAMRTGGRVIPLP